MTLLRIGSNVRTLSGPGLVQSSHDAGDTCGTLNHTVEYRFNCANFIWTLFDSCTFAYAQSLDAEHLG